LLESLEEELYLPTILVDGRYGIGAELHVVGKQDDFSGIFRVPNHNPPESMRAVSVSIEPIELNQLVPKHVPFDRNHVFIDHLVIRILLHAGDEVDTVFGPRTKEPVIIVAPVHGYNRTGVQRGSTRYRDIVLLSVGDIGITGEVTVVIQQKVKLDRTLGASELCPREN